MLTILAAILIVWIVLAVILPALGVPIPPAVSQIIGAVLAIVLLMWLLSVVFGLPLGGNFGKLC